jgi:hypothetical protein
MSENGAQISKMVERTFNAGGDECTGPAQHFKDEC